MTKSSTPSRIEHKSAVSIEDIATRARLSTTTVSMVLNGKGDQYRISKRSQERIQLLAEQLNYAPNQTARNLRAQETRNIGLVVADYSNYFFTQLAKHLEQVCRKNNYYLQISASEDDEAIEEEIIHNFIGQSVDGLIIASAHKHAGFLEGIAERTPTVFIDRQLKGQYCNWVCSDNYDSAYMLVKKLADSRPREIAYIGGTRTLSSTIERRRAYQKVLAEHDIPCNKSLMIEKNYSIDSGHQATLQILDHLGRLPDAIFTASFTLLEGALSALTEKFGAVPASVKIGTFDDHPLLDHAIPRIHSVRQDCESIAHEAFDILINITGQQAQPAHRTIPSILVPR
jgi:LacI family sucrose operon transcriptional repressor